MLLAIGLAGAHPAWSAEPAQVDADALDFDDFPREDILQYPDWFKQGFLDLRADLAEAKSAGKRGIMVYFGQRRCPYCRQLIQVNFGLQDITEYSRRHFDLIPIDIWGVEDVTTLSGETLSEREWAKAEAMEFTPAILFIDLDGKVALRLRGYYPPYQFRAALEFVADGHYQRESFRDYLARGEDRMVFDEEDLNEEPFFSPPPYDLDRRRPAERPLVVFFEQGNCHACDVLHGQVLKTAAISRPFADFDSLQLDMWSESPVRTPAGEMTTARRWAADLGLFYSPAMLFFDEQGREILRLDSVVGFYRLRNALSYVLSKAYLTQSYGEWRLSRSR